MAMNKILLQGRLTKDPEIRLTSKNDKVARFTIAVDRDFNREETDFINCVAFKATAAFIESYFTKGDMIIVAGRLQMQQYTAKDGSNRTAAEVMTDNVWFCGGKVKTKDASTEAQLTPVEDDNVYFGDSNRSESNDNQKENFNALSGRISDDLFPALNDGTSELPF